VLSVTVNVSVLCFRKLSVWGINNRRPLVGEGGGASEDHNLGKLKIYEDKIFKNRHLNPVIY